MLKNQAIAMQRVASDLGLPKGDMHTQDWAYELPEEFRSESWVDRYLAAYGNVSYGDTERRLLMDLLLDIANDQIEQDECAEHRTWNALVPLLRSRPELHRDQLKYWAALEDPIEDAFPLTHLARKLWEEVYS